MAAAMFDPLVAGWEAVDNSGFVGLVGPMVRRTQGDYDEYGFVAEPKHANLNNVVQGGMLMTFADRAFGRTAWQVAGRSTATIQFDMQFVSAARIGEFIETQPEVVRRTSALVFIRGMLFAGPRIVATAHGVWKILGS
jgi:acyl-coenzyme A thioesterase PaaI-like protein